MLKYGNIRDLSKDLRDLGWWLVKWYWLLTCPVFLIVLLNKRETGSTIKEELVLQPWNWLLACLTGPIGLACVSKTAALVWRYEKLRTQWQSEHSGYWPDEEVREVIWRQAEQPLLDFDEALTSVNLYQVRKPILACLLIWLLHLNFFPAAAKAVKGCRQTIACAMTQDEEDGVKANGSDNSLPLAILPPSVTMIKAQTVTGIVETDWQESKPAVRLAKSPRGPPVAVKEQLRKIISLSLDCSTQKRG